MGRYDKDREGSPIGGIILIIYFIFAISKAIYDHSPLKNHKSEKSDPLSGQISAKIHSVVDGDTIKGWINGKVETIELVDIDAPENIKNKKAKLQAEILDRNIDDIVEMGKKSKKFLQSLVKKGDRVTLKIDGKFLLKTGKFRAYVWVPSKNKIMLNEEMVCRGYALYSPSALNTKYTKKIIKCFENAKKEKKGLWM